MSELEKIQNQILEILENYEGDPICFKNLTSKMLKEVFFNKEGNLNDYLKEKYTKEEAFNLLQKMDLSDFSFDNIDITDVVLKSRGIKINPQTIKNKSLKNSVLINIEFIGSFDNVDLRNAAIINCTGILIDPNSIYNKNFENAIIKNGTFTYPFNYDVNTNNFTCIENDKIVKIIKK